MWDGTTARHRCGLPFAHDGSSHECWACGVKRTRSHDDDEDTTLRLDGLGDRLEREIRGGS